MRRKLANHAGGRAHLLLHASGDGQRLGKLRGGGKPLRRRGRIQTQFIVDDLPFGQLIVAHQGDGGAGVSCAAGAPDAVDKGHGIIGNLVVDDVGDIVDVDAARRDIGGDEDVHLARADGLQGLLPGLLAQVTVYGADAEAALSKVIGQLRGRAFGAGKDDAATSALGLQYMRDDRHLIHAVGLEGDLAGGFVRDLIRIRFSPDVYGLMHELARKVQDGAGHGGRKQHCLVRIAIECFQNGLYGRQKSQVQHLVGLIEHHDGDVAQDQIAALMQIEQAAWRADDHVDAALEELNLLLIGAPAVDGGEADRQVRGRVLQIRGDLLR